MSPHDGMPRAYLRIDPNLDQTHVDPGGMVALLCAAARQPDRGRFKDIAVLERALGKARVARMVDRHDLAHLEDGRWYVVGWDEWQEGDQTVGDRMRRMRARRKETGYVPPRTGRERTADWRIKKDVLERDGFACRYCGAYEYPHDLLIAEHVTPHPKGPTVLENLVTACRRCNVRKGGRTPDEAGMVLHPVGYRSAEDPLGDSSRVTRPVIRHDDWKRDTVTTDAVSTDSLLVVPLGDGDGDEIPPPPTSGGRRDEGTNPRAVGASPRQNGTSPRETGESPRKVRESQKRGPTKIGDILARAAAAGHES